MDKPKILTVREINEHIIINLFSQLTQFSLLGDVLCHYIPILIVHMCYVYDTNKFYIKIIS